MQRLVGFLWLFTCAVNVFSVADPRDRAIADRAVKLRNDFKSALLYVAPRVGLSESEINNLLGNLETMVPRENLLSEWRKSNKALTAVRIVSREDFPDMFELRDGILIIQKAPKGENISLTALYGADMTDPDGEKEMVKDSKRVARNSEWAYRFVMNRSRLIGGFNNDVATVKPIFLLKYTDEFPFRLRVYNDGIVYIMGDAVIEKLEIEARDNGVFGCDNITVEELVVDQRDNTVVTLRGKTASMDAVVDDTATLEAGEMRADIINMNLSRNDCKKVVVNPQKRLITIGRIKTGTFQSLNQNVKAEDGSVVWRNIKNMGGRVEKAIARPTRLLVFGAGYLTWKIVTIPFKFLGALGRRLSKARVGVGGSVGVGPVRVGAGVII